MRKTILAIGAAGAVAVPALALAEPPTTTTGPGKSSKTPAAFCRTERNNMGEENFKNTYGVPPGSDNAFGKCVSKQAHNQNKNKVSAAGACHTEQAQDPAAFTLKYGTVNTNSQGKGKGKSPSAFSRCVRQGTNKNTVKEQSAELSAVGTCRKEESTDPDQFETDFGTARNAFAKCVTHEKFAVLNPQAQPQEQPQPPPKA